MPYISETQKNNINKNPYELNSPGELTYALTKVVLEYLGETANFSEFASVLGCLEATKLELYRRMIAPYEDGKIKQNGDVYPQTKKTVRKTTRKGSNASG